MLAIAAFFVGLACGAWLAFPLGVAIADAHHARRNAPEP